MNQIEKTAKEWAKTYKYERDKDMQVAAHDSFLMGWSAAKMQAVSFLNKQHDGCQAGTKVSYAIAADVLKLDFKEYEDAQVSTVPILS